MEQIQIWEKPIISMNSHQKEGISYLYMLMEEYKFDRAYLLLQELKQSEKFFSSLNCNDFEKIAELEEIYKQIVNITTEMDMEADWIVEKIKAGEENIMLKYKQIPGTSLYALKYEAVLEIPIFNLVAMIYEIDLFRKWIPFCSSSRTVKKIGKAFKIAYFHLDLPFLSNRETYIKGIGVDRLDENGTILIVSGSVDTDENFKKKYNVEIEENPKVVRLDLKTCGMEITPQTRNKFKVRVISNCDPKIAYIPDFILNFCIRKGGSFLFDKMISNAKNIEGTEWEEKIKSIDDRDFYSWVEKKLDSYFKSKN